MPCPHSSSWSADPSTCSQCIGAGARVVRSDERGVTVDGVMVREGLRGALVGAAAKGDLGPGRGTDPGPRRHGRQKRKPRAPTSPVATAVDDGMLAGAVEAVAAITFDDDVFTSAATTATVDQADIPIPPGGFSAADLIDYGTRYATLALPTPAGSEGIALLETFALCEDDAYLIALHRAGQLRLVTIENMLAVEDSLRRRGDNLGELEAVVMDGVPHHGIAVIATSAQVEDLADFAEQVLIHHRSGPMAQFVTHAFKLATGKQGQGTALVAEARRFLAGEWDRIRGVLPPAARSRPPRWRPPAAGADVRSRVEAAAATKDAPPGWVDKVMGEIRPR